MRNRDGDPLVEGRRQQGGLPVPRVAEDDDSLRVDIGVGDQIIHGSLKPPGPGGDRAPVVRTMLGLPGLRKNGNTPSLKPG